MHVRSLEIRDRRILFFLLSLLLIGPCLFSEQDRGNLGLARYWREAGDFTPILREWIVSENCHESKTKFLACVNALEVMGRWRGAELRMPPRWIKNPNRSQLFANEKARLTKWASLFEARNAKSKKSLFPFESLLDQLLDSSLWQERLSEEKISYMKGSGLNAFLSVVADPHTYLIPRNYYEEIVARQSVRSASFGLVFKARFGFAQVRKVLAHSPAESAGIERGDQILQIDGRPVSTLLPHEMNDIGVAGKSTEVTLLLRRGRPPFDQYEVRLRNNFRELQNSEAKIISREKGLGLIAIHKFSLGICEQVRTQIKDLKLIRLKGLIIDLRDNPGGYMDEALCVTGLFLSQGTPILEAHSLDPAQKIERHFSAEKEALYRGPIVLLVNSGTASAAEIVAGSLRDLGRGRLLGERTFGKGTYQDGDVWERNEKLILFKTEGIYYFPSGFSPQAVGLAPDIEVKEDIGNGLAPPVGEAEQYYSVVESENFLSTASEKVESFIVTEPRANLKSSDCRSVESVPQIDKQIEFASRFVQCSHGYQSTSF